MMTQQNPETLPLSKSRLRAGAETRGPRSDRAIAGGECSRERCEQLFLDNLVMVRRLVTTVARQHRMLPEDADDLVSLVYLKLVGDDYAVLRTFRGHSTLKSFLAVVVERVYLDYRTAQWGKWRASVGARRKGELAILLEQLMVRDGHTFDEAFAMLDTARGGSLRRTMLEQLSHGFRPRLRPRFVSQDEMREAPQSKAAADATLVHSEDQRVMTRAMEALTDALERLTPRDRLIVTLRFCDGMSVADIARMLTVKQKGLYPRINRLVRGLRLELEAAGVCGEEVLSAVERTAAGEGCSTECA